ncbi:Rft-1-domain-containing protein [Xylariaceae sp. FL0804]|nr:Rft-1-domain-containing protein [Xylariaceae sp. FL0804]
MFASSFTVSSGSSSSDSPRAQGSAVRGASLLIALQVASRAVTFVANQLLLRFMTARLLGVATQLEVYYLSVLFFARESLRVAVQRQGTRQEQETGSSSTTSPSTPSSSSSPSSAPADAPSSSTDAAATDQATAAQDAQAVVNVAHLSLLLGLASALGLGWAYLRWADNMATGTATDTEGATPHLGAALRVYGAAALVELLSEPAFAVLQHRLRLRPRAAAESLATLARCAVTFAAAAAARRRDGLDNAGVLPFALGQLAYGVALLAVYAWYGARLALSEGFSLLPRRRRRRRGGPHASSSSDDDDDDYVLGYFFRPTLQLASSLMSQSLVKHVLTQGDTFLVSMLSDPASQGVYALANNYGGLLARLVFQPIEESSRNYFSKLLSSASSTSTSASTSISASAAAAQSPSSSSPGDEEKEREKDKKAPPLPPLRQARADLQALFKFYALLSTVVVTVGPYAAPLLVQLVAGARWSGSGAGRVLAVYCLYVPLLAANGAAEAFVASAASRADLHRQSLWMGGFSLAFGAAGFVALRLLGLGAAGLVAANAVNMLCRIAWSGSFISSYFARNGGKGDGGDGGDGEVSFGWRAVVPDAMALHAAAAAVFVGVMARAGVGPGEVSPHVFRDLVAVGAAAVPYVSVIAYAERRYLADCYRSIRGSRRP